ncbi:MAG: tetratricopeptide repeat protein [Patescibacteria group bacterium]|jgi:tetratricopeptide (TPR) repeat protein
MEKLELDRLKNMAVEKAIEGNFEEAVKVNLEVLKVEPEDTDTLMQLAHAYWQMGNIKSAKLYYRKTLDIDPNNILARKRTTLLKTLSSDKALNVNRKKGRIVPITDLIEEPGKTKTVRLSYIGKPEHLSLLTVGEEVSLSIRKRKIEVRDLSANFIGYLPDDISKRLIEFMNNDCVYQAFIFSIEKNEVRVFIKEISKGKKFRNKPSFTYEDILEQKLDDDAEDASESGEEDTSDIDDDESLLVTPEEHHAKHEVEEESSDDEEEDHEYEE